MTPPLPEGPTPTPLGRVFYWIGKTGSNLLFTLFSRVRVRGRENVPRAGALIIAPNHASFADPPLVGSQLPRTLFYMGKEELFRIPVFGWILRQVNAFPIRRKEGDIAAIKAAERILNAGGALIVFPEGRRQRNGQLAAPKRGVGLLAVRTGVPVLPVYVHNAHRILRLAQITIVFGRPISPAAGETAEVFSQRVMDAVRQLKEAHFGTPS